MPTMQNLDLHAVDRVCIYIYFTILLFLFQIQDVFVIKKKERKKDWYCSLPA